MKLPTGFELLAPAKGEYQKETILYGCLNDSAGFLLGLGLGKTYCAINTARYRIQFNNVKKVLVVCPSTIMHSWEKSIKLFSEYKPVVLYGTRKVKLKQFRKKGEFYIINYESLYPFREQLFQLKPDMIIFDESARYVKGNDSQRTTMSITLADMAKFKLILTGTIISNKPLYLWSQMRLLDGGEAFTDNFYRFRNKFFKTSKKRSKDGKHYKKYSLTKKSVDYFSKVIYDNCIRYKREDVRNDLPEEVFDIIKIPLGELKGIYETVVDGIIDEIETSQGATKFKHNGKPYPIFTKLLRLQQVTSGFITDNNGEINELKNQPKLDALVELVSSIHFEEESVIIWCRFIKSIDMIAKKLRKCGIKCITMDGRQKTPAEKYERWHGFQTDKTVTAFIGQMQSGGIGTELFKEDCNKTQHMLFYENVDLDTRSQCLGRNNRIGQLSKTLMYKDLIIEDTFDERILDNINNDKSIRDDIMENGLKNVLKRR